MSANFITKGKVTYSPEIQGKIIIEAESQLLTVPEYRVIYGSVNLASGKPNYVGGIVSVRDSLEEAKHDLIAFSGYGRPKQPFMGDARSLKDKRKGLGSFSNMHSSKALTPLGNTECSNLEKTLRQKWKI